MCWMKLHALCYYRKMGWFKREVTEEVEVVVTPYIRILEVFGSNLGLDSGYSGVSLPFPPGSRQMPGVVQRLAYSRFLPNSFEFIIHLSSATLKIIQSNH